MNDNAPSQAARRREAAQKTANGHFQVWEDRKQLVKKEMADASAANDAKTARLKAMRLEKEQADAEAAALAPPKPVAVKKTAVKKAVAKTVKRASA